MQIIKAIDQSKRVFINENCYKEEATGKYLLEQLDKMGFSKNYLVRGVDLDIAKNGDYKIRCIGGELTIFEVEFRNDNLILKPIGKL